jgi:hypothetical protein
LATDQRGLPRLFGAHVDIGAVEVRTASANNRPILGSPSYSSEGNGFLPENGFSFTTFTFSFTNTANADFTILTSTNLSLPLVQWTVLGNASQTISPGQFEYSDVMVGSYFHGVLGGVFPAPQQFYRVVSP